MCDQYGHKLEVRIAVPEPCRTVMSSLTTGMWRCRSCPAAEGVAAGDIHTIPSQAKPLSVPSLSPSKHTGGRFCRQLRAGRAESWVGGYVRYAGGTAEVSRPPRHSRQPPLPGERTGKAFPGSAPLSSRTIVIKSGVDEGGAEVPFHANGVKGIFFSHFPSPCPFQYSPTSFQTKGSQ